MFGSHSFSAAIRQCVRVCGRNVHCVAVAASAAAVCVAAPSFVSADSHQTIALPTAATSTRVPEQYADVHKHLAQTSLASSPWDTNWDFREPEEGEDGPTATRHIILVRHGQYVTKHPQMRRELTCEDDFLHNDPLRKLTPLGVKQAHIAGKTIARLIEVEKRRRPDLKVHVYCSDMARAHETGSIIHGHLKQQVEQEKGKGADDPLPLHVDSMLREGAPMWPEGYAGNWAPEPHEFYEEAARIEAAFRKHIHRASPSQDQDSVTVLVCHGNVIRYLMLRALQLPPGAWLRFSIYNACGTRLIVRPSGSVSMRSMGDALGLDAAEMSYH